MAVWQFDVELIPAAVVGTPDMGPASPVGDAPETSGWWANHQPEKDYVPLIERFLPERSSWSPELRVWGSEKETCVKVWKEKATVTGMSVRLDARSLNRDLLVNVLGLAQALRCKLYLVELAKIVDPDLQLLVKEIAVSPAGQFVQNPERFIQETMKPKDKE